MQTDTYEFVKCIDASESAHFLNEGQVYSIAVPHDGYMYFVEELGSYWSSDRFKILQSNNKIKDIFWDIR